MEKYFHNFQPNVKFANSFLLRKFPSVQFVFQSIVGAFHGWWLNCMPVLNRSITVVVWKVRLLPHQGKSRRPGTWVTCHVTAILATWRRRPYISMATSRLPWQQAPLQWLTRPERQPSWRQYGATPPLGGGWLKPRVL